MLARNAVARLMAQPQPLQMSRLCWPCSPCPARSWAWDERVKQTRREPKGNRLCFGPLYRKVQHGPGQGPGDGQAGLAQHQALHLEQLMADGTTT